MRFTRAARLGACRPKFQNNRLAGSSFYLRILIHFTVARFPVNPLPALVMTDDTRISDRSPTPPWAATDRYCGAIGRARIDTN